MGKLRDGIIRRGSKWYFVIRVTDHEKGLSRPRWVGGFATEGEAKAERDEARVRARRGDYVDRSRMTVTEYFIEWLDAHAVEIKPKTLAGYRDLVARYVLPRVGSMRLQAVRAATLTKLYRDLLEAGGRGGRPLSNRTVDQVHAIVRKALTDAVRVDEVLASNPAERAKRPRRTRKPVGSVARNVTSPLPKALRASSNPCTKAPSTLARRPSPFSKAAISPTNSNPCKKNSIKPSRKKISNKPRRSATRSRIQRKS